MTPFYQILGLTAALCSRLSRTRVNSLPAHGWVMFVCIIALVIGSDIQLRDGAQYGKPPTPMTVRQAIASDHLNEYVQITGPIDPKQAIEVTGNSSHETLLPLYDPKLHTAILMEAHPDGGRQGGYTGMLRPLASDLAAHLRDQGDQLGRNSVVTEFQLTEGQTPVNPRWFWLTCVIAGVPLLLLATSVSLRHIIFQKTGYALRRELAEAEKPQGPLRFSGRLSLGPKTGQRFLGMPVGLGTTSGGEWAFVSRIDASIRDTFGGVTDRSGQWASIIQAGSLRIGDEGNQYLGAAPRPALRLHYVDAALAKPRRETVVLTFETVSDRDWARRTLSATPEPALQNAP